MHDLFTQKMSESNVIPVAFCANGGRTDKKRVDDFNRAFDFVKRAAELEGDSEKLRIAKHLLESALKIDPDYVPALSRLIYVNNALGLYEEAYEAAKRAYDLEPKNPLLVYNLGTVCLHLERYDDALLLLKKVVKMSPKMSAAYYNIASVYGRTGLNNTALKYKEIADRLEAESEL